MCSKQLLLRKTACRTGLSEHCRISGTAAKIDNTEDVDSPYLLEINDLVSILIEREIKTNDSYSARLETYWTCSYLAFDSGVRSDCLPSFACLVDRCSVDGSS